MQTSIYPRTQRHMITRPSAHRSLGRQHFLLLHFPKQAENHVQADARDALAFSELHCSSEVTVAYQSVKWQGLWLYQRRIARAPPRESELRAPVILGVGGPVYMAMSGVYKSSQSRYFSSQLVTKHILFRVSSIVPFLTIALKPHLHRLSTRLSSTFQCS